MNGDRLLQHAREMLALLERHLHEDLAEREGTGCQIVVTERAGLIGIIVTLCGQAAAPPVGAWVVGVFVRVRALGLRPAKNAIRSAEQTPPRIAGRQSRFIRRAHATLKAAAAATGGQRHQRSTLDVLLVRVLTEEIEQRDQGGRTGAGFLEALRVPVVAHEATAFSAFRRARSPFIRSWA